MKFRNQISAIFLLTLLFLKAMITPALYLNFELNKENIIKNYCVNKNRPELHCDGKCFLSKKIKSAQEKEEQQGFQSFVQKLLEVNSYDCSFKYSFNNSLTIKYLPVNNFFYLQTQKFPN